MKKFLKLFLFTLILFNLTPAIANTLNVSTASYSIVINGEKWKPDNPIIAINGKTYIPLTEIAELLDVDVSWNEKKRQVEINKEADSSEDDEKNEEETEQIEDKTNKMNGLDERLAIKEAIKKLNKREKQILNML